MSCSAYAATTAGTSASSQGRRRSCSSMEISGCRVPDSAPGWTTASTNLGMVPVWPASRSGHRWVAKPVSVTDSVARPKVSVGDRSAQLVCSRPTTRLNAEHPGLRFGRTQPAGLSPGSTSASGAECSTATNAFSSQPNERIRGRRLDGRRHELPSTGGEERGEGVVRREHHRRGGNSPSDPWPGTNFGSESGRERGLASQHERRTPPAMTPAVSSN